MPRETSQAESWVSPPRARVLIHGEPLSTSIALGTPYVPKSFSSTFRTVAVLVLATRTTASIIRLIASRTVRGSHRCPFLAFHQPLKSMVQRSFGACTSICGRSSTCHTRTRGRRTLTLPAALRILATVARLGVSSSKVRLRTRTSLSGPQVVCLARSASTEATTSLLVIDGDELGRRLSSCKLSYPPSRNRLSHL